MNDTIVCPKCYKSVSTAVLEHRCLPEGDKFNDVTTCTKCNEETRWEFYPQGSQWLCSHCGSINTTVPQEGGLSCNVEYPIIYRVDYNSEINTKNLEAMPGKFVGLPDIISDPPYTPSDCYLPPSLEERSKEERVYDPRAFIDSPVIQAIVGGAEAYLNGPPMKVEGKTTIYLSGPMLNIPNLNHSEFQKYADKYRELGFQVFSPHEMYTGKDPHEGMRTDLVLLASGIVDRLYLLPGWDNGSRGVKLERHVAEYFDIPQWFAETNEPFSESITHEAERVVYGSRRKEYGHALDNFEHTAAMESAAFKHKLKEPLTAEDMAIFMMVFKLSRLILSPDHRDSKVDIVGYDLCYDDVQTARKMRNTQMPKREDV